MRTAEFSNIRYVVCIDSFLVALNEAVFVGSVLLGLPKVGVRVAAHE